MEEQKQHSGALEVIPRLTYGAESEPSSARLGAVPIRGIHCQRDTSKSSNKFWGHLRESYPRSVLYHVCFAGPELSLHVVFPGHKHSPCHQGTRLVAPACQTPDAVGKHRQAQAKFNK